MVSIRMLVDLLWERVPPSVFNSIPSYIQELGLFGGGGGIVFWG